jgi:hypothetical protein
MRDALGVSEWPSAKKKADGWRGKRRKRATVMIFDMTREGNVNEVDTVFVR